MAGLGSLYLAAMQRTADGSSTVAGRYGDFANPNTITFDATHTLTSTGRWEELFIARYDPQGVVKAAGNVIVQAIASFDGLSPDQIRKDRREKFLAMGRAQ